MIKCHYCKEILETWPIEECPHCSYKYIFCYHETKRAIEDLMRACTYVGRNLDIKIRLNVLPGIHAIYTDNDPDPIHLAFMGEPRKLSEDEEKILKEKFNE